MSELFSETVALGGVTDTIRTNRLRQFQAGVRPYALDYYVPD